MNAVLYPLAALTAWTAAAYKLPAAIRRPREPSLISLVAALTVLGIIFTISTPTVWTKIDHAAGRPNLSFLLSQVSVMIWTVIVQVMMVRWASPSPHARRMVKLRLLMASGTIAVMVTLFLQAPILPEDSTDFAARFAHVPAIATYLCVYVLAFAWMQGEIVTLCLRTSQAGGRVWLRRGLRATAVGAMLGLVYCVVRASDVIFGMTGVANPVRWEDIARLAVGVGVLLPPIGWTMPSWGPRLTRMRAWAVNVRNYWHLYPLWSVLRTTFADKDLDPPHGLAARIALRNLSDWRLPRRLALIWDSMLELQPYQEPDRELSVANRDGPPQRRELRKRARTEADVLLAALAVYRQGGLSALGASATVPSRETTGSECLSSEMDWLVAVSRAVRRHPAWAPETARTSGSSRTD